MALANRSVLSGGEKRAVTVRPGVASKMNQDSPLSLVEAGLSTLRTKYNHENTKVGSTKDDTELSFFVLPTFVFS
jgi:hypothetical protein